MTADRRSFPWRAAFHRTTAAVFVAGPTGRLRYANPAWEAVTGRPLADLRGMRLTARKSGSALGRALAPPPEAWAGRAVEVRRPPPGEPTGPPWWDVRFVPFPGADGKPLMVVGVVAVAGDPGPKAAARAVPAAVADLRRRFADRFPLDLFAGAGPAADRLLSQARLAASTAAPVWLVGEPGVGKRTLARAVHAAGPAREKAFFALDPGLQPYLADGLLTGKGGLADAGRLGTLYVPHPGSLPRDFQAKLVKLLTRPNGPRAICGSPQPPGGSGGVLPEFERHLAVLEIAVPPLRERADDLPRLASVLLPRFPRADGSVPAVADDAWPVLRAYRWPGNVRELADVLGGAAERAGDGPIARDHLPRRLREAYLLSADPLPPAAPKLNLDAVLEAVERRLIELALARAGGNQTEAAAALGVFRSRLVRRLDALRIGERPA